MPISASVGAEDLETGIGRISEAGFGITGNHQPGGDIGTGLLAEECRHGELFQHTALEHLFLYRRTIDDERRDRVLDRIEKRRLDRSPRYVECHGHPIKV